MALKRAASILLHSTLQSIPIKFKFLFYFMFFCGDFETLSRSSTPLSQKSSLTNWEKHILNRNGVIHLPSDNTVTSGSHRLYTWHNHLCLHHKITGTPGNVFVPPDDRVASLWINPCLLRVHS